MLNDALPPDSADREWVDLINEANQGWKEATEFLIEKRNKGRTMIEDEVSYQQASLEATTLLGDMYTEEITYQAAMDTNRRIKTLGTKWAQSANEFYEMIPSTRARRGLNALIGDMNLQTQWEYNQRTNPGITLRSFEPLRSLERENNQISKEIYQNKPQEVPAAPAIPQPGEEMRREPENQEDLESRRREREKERKLELFHTKFLQVAKLCDGKVTTMAGGRVEYMIDQTKELTALYDKL